MSALRRIHSGGVAPPAIPLSGRQGAVFVAISAVGLSLGAAWAWHAQKKRPALELQA